MAAWMLGSVVAATVFTLAGLLCERALTLLGRPSRWLWLGVMALSGCWPFAARLLLPTTAVTPAGNAASAAAATTVSGGVSATALLPGVPDVLLVSAWAVASALLILTLMLSAESLNSDRRRWRARMVAGETVYVSGGIGPAVIGMFDVRIVLPRWVLELEAEAQRMIVLHELEHVRAGDNRFLGSALALLVALPWCLPLWWQFQRMRAAIETDCDQRVLTGGASVAVYAHALVTVAERRRRSLLPHAAMAHSQSALARRIARMATPGSYRRTPAAAGLIAAAVPAIVLAASVPMPSPPSIPDAAGASRANRFEGGIRPAGALPGDPGQARLAVELMTHHSAALAAGLPKQSVIWFIAGRDGDVVRTGIEHGEERDIIARLRARYPAEVSDYALAWSDVPTSSGPAHVLWVLPPR